jgi:hypothetical protein
MGTDGRGEKSGRSHSADEILHHIPTFRCPFGSRLSFSFYCVCVCALSAGVVGRKLALVAIDPKSPESLKQMEANCVSRSFPHR